jgi:hypothetical protein
MQKKGHGDTRLDPPTPFITSHPSNEVLIPTAVIIAKTDLFAAYKDVMRRHL